MTYKLIASDIDGTLVGEDSVLSKENLDAIKRIKESGVYFVPTSGRSFFEMPEAITSCEDIRYYITSNGACTYDKETGKEMLFSLSGEKVKELLSIIGDYDVCYSAHKEKWAYFDQRMPEQEMIYFSIEKAYRDVFMTQMKHLEDIRDFTKDDKTEMFVAFFHDMDERLACLERLKKVEGITVTGSIPYNVEIISNKATKGNALSRLLEHLSIKKEQTIAVGDSPNDTTLLSAAGLPLAVENALPALKKMAKEVICPQSEHSAKYILEHFIL